MDPCSSLTHTAPSFPASMPPPPPPGRAGGAYIPPFKLARMMAEVADKASPEAQRMTWDALRKSLNGLVNKVGGCRGARAGEGGGGAGAQEGGREGR
jgi:hypothetical protein